jgi:hypothetical protein
MVAITKSDQRRCTHLPQMGQNPADCQRLI